MGVQPASGPQAALGMAVRWGLLVLAVGAALAYLLLSSAVAGAARSGLYDSQLGGQQALVVAMCSHLDADVRSGEDALTAFDRLASFMTLQLGSAGGGLSLVDPEGSVVAQQGAGEIAAAGELTGLVVRDPRSGAAFSFDEYLSLHRKLQQPPAGLLYSAAGTPQRQSIATARVPANGWSLVVHQGTRPIEEVLSTVRLYLLVSFLCLAILVLLFVLRIYHSLAVVFNTAVRSSEALTVASTTFQESLGVMRAPLHNIQGLADLLCLAADSVERERYAEEIKTEVRKLIEMFKKAEI